MTTMIKARVNSVLREYETCMRDFAGCPRWSRGIFLVFGCCSGSKQCHRTDRQTKTVHPSVAPTRRPTARATGAFSHSPACTCCTCSWQGRMGSHGRRLQLSRQENFGCTRAHSLGARRRATFLRGAACGGRSVIGVEKLTHCSDQLYLIAALFHAPTPIRPLDTRPAPGESRKRPRQLEHQLQCRAPCVLVLVWQHARRAESRQRVDLHAHCAPPSSTPPAPIPRPPTAVMPPPCARPS